MVKWPWGKRSQKLGENKEKGKKNKKEEGKVKKTDKRGRGQGDRAETPYSKAREEHLQSRRHWL